MSVFVEFFHDVFLTKYFVAIGVFFQVIATSINPHNQRLIWSLPIGIASSGLICLSVIGAHWVSYVSYDSIQGALDDIRYIVILLIPQLVMYMTPAVVFAAVTFATKSLKNRK